MLRFQPFIPWFFRLVPGVVLACILGAEALRGQEAPAEAIVAPVASIGAVSDAERAIVFNSLQEHLSARFRVVSQEAYRAAEERAFQELDLEQCTAEQCIRKIQDLLQVERFFVLQLIREGDFTQLSLTLVTLEGKTVKNDTCSGCGIGQLNEKVAGLVAKVLGEAPRPEVAAPAAPLPPAARPAPAAPTARRPPPASTPPPKASEPVQEIPQKSEPSTAVARRVMLMVWGTDGLFIEAFLLERITLGIGRGIENDSGNYNPTFILASRFFFSSGSSWFLGGSIESWTGDTMILANVGYQWIWSSGFFVDLLVPYVMNVGWAF